MASQLNPEIIVSFAIVLASSFIALKILIDLATPSHRRRYSRAVRYNLLIGAILGAVLPWKEEPALIAAAIAGILLLASALYFHLLRGWVRGHSLHIPWSSREAMREWFLYYSITAGVIGVVTTLVSLIGPLFNIQISFFVPLVFDSISILAALLDFTIYLPPYEIIFAQIFNYVFPLLRNNSRANIESIMVEDFEFEKIREGSVYSELDIRDAFESLVKKGMATTQWPTMLGKVRYKINIDGLRYLDACSGPARAIILSEKRKLEKAISYLNGQVLGNSQLPGTVKARAISEYRSLKSTLRELEETYGSLLEESWRDRILVELEADLATLTGSSSASARYQRTTEGPPLV